METKSTVAYLAPSRKGKTLIGGHFDPDIKRELKIIAAQEETSIQALLEEAIGYILKSRNLSKDG